MSAARRSAFSGSASARIVATRCADAYSADRFAEWSDVAAVLLAAGYSDLEAEAIMRSKYTRWAADDCSAEYGAVPAKAVTDYLARFPKLVSKAALAALVAETFA